MGIYIIVCNASAHAQTCPCSSWYENEFLHVRIANTCVPCKLAMENETRQRARRLTLRRERVQQARTTKQIKSTRLRKSFFQRKIDCLRWDSNPRHSALDRVLCQLSRQGSSVDMGRISYTNTKQGKANHLNLINR